MRPLKPLSNGITSVWLSCLRHSPQLLFLVGRKLGSQFASELRRVDFVPGGSACKF